MCFQFFLAILLIFGVNALDPEEEAQKLSPLWEKTVCGLEATTPQNVGGDYSADFKQFPWAAALEYYSKNANRSAGIRCVGSLITDRFVLTAAHCIVHQDLVVIKAWLGATNINSEGNCLNRSGTSECNDSIQKRIVINAFPHPQYSDSRRYNDIGLLRLGHKIKFTEYIRPICLLHSSPSLKIGTNLMVTGWSTTKEGTLSGIKLKTDVPLQNKSVCNQHFMAREVSLEQICVGSVKSRDVCLGDSGGLLLKSFTNRDGKTQWYQYGIGASDSGCGINERPAIYTSVSEHFDWIIAATHDKNRPLEKQSTCETQDLRRGTCVMWYTCRKNFSAEEINHNDPTENCGFELTGDMGRDRRRLVCCESPDTVLEPNLEIEALPDKTVCGMAKTKSSINGNSVAEFGEFPWVVGIAYKSSQTNKSAGIRCAASLISNRHVLAPASCLTNQEYEPVGVWLGDWNITMDPDCGKTKLECVDPVKKVKIKEIIQPTLFSDSRIALIVLKNEIQFTDYIRPICLPSSNVPSLESGTHVTVAGWGTAQKNYSSAVLRKEQILLGSKNGCDTGVHPLKFPEQCIDSDTWAVREIEGPVMTNYDVKPSGKDQWYLHGLFVTPFKFIRVASYVNWIANVISQK